MSEYTPITGELREYATVAWDPWPEARDRLYQMCDAIDSIHAQLERENESLKAELDRVLREQDRDGWIELPKDADGVPIRLGDELVDTTDKFHCGKAHIIELKEDGWIVFVGNLGKRPHVYRHVTPDTWEHIIEDAIGEGMARQRNNDSGNFCERANPMNNGDLVARCKALCERTKEDA